MVLLRIDSDSDFEVQNDDDDSQYHHEQQHNPHDVVVVLPRGSSSVAVVVAVDDGFELGRETFHFGLKSEWGCRWKDRT